MHWKWSCEAYYGQTSAVSGGPAVTAATDRCREDGPTTAVPGSAVRTAGCCSNKCPHLDHLTNQRFGHFDPFYPFPYTSRPKRSRFCHIFLVQSLVWKYCLKLEGCLHNFFLIGPYSAAAEPNSAPKIVTQFLEPSLVLLRRFCLNVRILRMSFQISDNIPCESFFHLINI